MTPGILALLLGAFVLPGLLLWLGHRLRRRTPRWRAAFWGGVTGHVIALVVGSIAAMTPAAHWSADDTLRGALGLWSFLVLPIVGAAVGMFRAARP
jgi:hypothetical protein